MGTPISKELALALVAVEEGKKLAEKAKGWCQLEPMVFLSYARADHAVASALSGILGELGISHFHDVQHMQWGDHVKERIKRSIAECTHLIFVASEASAKSDWVIYELGQAETLSKAVLGFALTSDVRSDVMRRHHYVTDYASVRAYFQQPSIDTSTLAGFYYEVFKPVRDKVASQSLVLSSSGGGVWEWRTPQRASESGVALTIGEVETEPYLRLQFLRPDGSIIRECCSLRYDPEYQAVRVDGTSEIGWLLNADKPVTERVREGERHGFPVSRFFWTEAIRHLRELDEITPGVLGFGVKART